MLDIKEAQYKKYICLKWLDVKSLIKKNNKRLTQSPKFHV